MGIQIIVNIERENINEDKLEKKIKTPFVNCPFFKASKVETWFLIISNGYNRLLTVKRFIMNKLIMNFKLQFNAPQRSGFYEYQLFLMSDSYFGLDQELKLPFEAKNSIEIKKKVL